MKTTTIAISLLAAVLGTGGVAAQDSPADTPAAQVERSQTRVYTGNLTIEEGESVGDVLVIGGDLRIRGEVTGDAVVVNGDLILDSTGLVQGDAVVTAGEVRNEGGRIRGEMLSIQGQNLNLGELGEVGERIRGEVAAATTAEREVRAEATSSRQRRGFGPVRRGIAGIISTLALGLVLAGVGSALVFYGRPYLETVSDTVRGAPLRSGLTGLAASFLAVPAFVVLIVALVVSIIGIPFLLVAVPLYPVALFAAGVFGLLGVTHAIGERTTEQTRDALDLRYRNSYAYLFTGLGMLLLPHIAAHLISMTGFLGFIGAMLRFLTWLAIWVAGTVGFGAVILSRGGRRRTFAVQMPVSSGYDDVDDLLDDDAFAGQGHA